MDNTSTYFFIFIIVILFGALVYLKNKKLMESKALYEQSLKGKDKAKALELGRNYYRILRAGPFALYGTRTIFDEQAISNDIAAMNV